MVKHEHKTIINAFKIPVHVYHSCTFKKVNQTRSVFALFGNFVVIVRIRQFDRHPFSQDHPALACRQVLTHQKAANRSVTEAAPRKRVFFQGTVCAPSKIVQSRVEWERGVKRTHHLFFLFEDEDTLNQQVGSTVSRNQF